MSEISNLFYLLVGTVIGIMLCSQYYFFNVMGGLLFAALPGVISFSSDIIREKVKA